MPKRLAALLTAMFCNAVLIGAAHAAPPADAPAGAMGVCNDGSYSTAAAKRGACRGHKGVKDWYGSETAAATPGGPKATSTSTSTAPAATPAPSTTTTTTATTPAPAPTAAPSRSTTTTTAANSAAAKQPAAGGGPGLVWVNNSSKIYHCAGSRWYGKSKEGSYMSEANAKTQGNRPSHGKDCAGT